MTISTTDSRISYNGNGVTTVFSFPYRFLTNGDIVVVSVSSTGVETVKTLTTDYTLTGAGDDAGGSVTMLVAPASGTRLIIYRDTDITQETDYISGDPFPAETHERALDRLTMIAQEIGSDADRSIKVPVGDSSSLSTTLPAAANRLDRLLAFDSATGEVELSGITQTQIASAVAAAYAAGSTADAVTFLQAGTGAVSESVQVALRRFVHIDQFGAVGDSTTDDLIPLTRFFESAIANPGVPHILGSAIYATTGALPTINVSNVIIRGAGSTVHDISPLMNGTVIKYTGTAGATVLTISSISGGSNQMVSNVEFSGIGINANSLADYGLITNSLRDSLIDVAVCDAKVDNWKIGVVATLGEATDFRRNRIRYTGRSVDYASGVPLRLTGDSSANVSFNVFEVVEIVHRDGIGIIEENADNNLWQSVRVYRAAGGSATNSIEWRGGASAGVACRDERFVNLSTTVAAIAKGTGTYTVGATTIVIDFLDVTNSTPTPTEETGATIMDGKWRTFTSTITATAGAFTSVSGAIRYLRELRRCQIELVIVITTAGSAAGAGSTMTATLPCTVGSAATSRAFGSVSSTGVGVLGTFVAAGTTLNSIALVTGATAVVNGYTIVMNGVCETA